MTEKTAKPEIRFKGFSDDWEQRKLGDIAIRSSVISSESDLPRVEYEDIISGTGNLNKDVFAKESDKTGIVFHKGDVLYGKLRPYLQNWLLPSFNGIAVGDFWVLQPQNTDSNFLYRLIQSHQFDEIANQSTGTKMPRADWRLVSNTEFFIPSTIDEQSLIGTYFEQFDNLITLYQRKYDNLMKVKKAMLEKMFPKKGATVPEIRFKGFSDAWEQRKVSEITNFHKQGFYTTEPYDNSKKYYLLRGTDLTDNKLILRDTPKIDATDKDYQAFKTQIGDFLIVRSGTVGTYGIVYDDIPAIFGSYLINFRFDKIQVTNEFFGYFYQSDLFKNQLRQIIQQSANTNINAENIKSTFINLPSLPEQKKIGDFFAELDNLITLHQGKLEKLKNIKKACLEKMFV